DIITTASQTVTTGGDVTVIGSATALTDQDGGVTQAGLNDLKTNVTGYAVGTGVLTINTNSAIAGELKLAATAGLEFSVDSGTYSTTPPDDLDDDLTHTIDVRLASTGEVIGRITLDNVDGAGAGAGTLAFDMGTGMFAETSTVVDNLAPMENYLALSDGTFQIRDSNSTLLGTVSYQKGDSLASLAASISTNVTNVSATVVQSGNTFKLEVLHDNRDTLTFDADTGGLIALLNITNGGDGVFSANIDGAVGGGGDLSVTVNGRTITGLSLTGAEGLRVFYNGTVDLDAVQLDFTTGFGERLFFAIDAMLAPVTGLMDANIASLTKQNEVRQDRVDDMVARLEQTQALLLQKFINMEVALARAKNLRDSLTQTFDAMFASKNF
ncbi:MAG: hypothetical protein IIA36_14720, partial [Proteobacteria bacterium]|nr:hypothetical protein [Pseudomonadota bacterium]